MGIKKKHVPGCTCCGGCTYVASDGNEFSDNFDSGVDASWQVQNGTLASVSGELEITLTSEVADPALAYQSITIASATDLLIIIEVTHRRNLRNAGFGIGSTANGDPEVAKFSFLLNVNGFCDVRSFNVNHIISVPFSDGDKFTIKLQSIGGGDVRACYFVEEELIYEETGTFDLTTLTKYALGEVISSIGNKVYFDNFTIHMGNP